MVLNKGTVAFQGRISRFPASQAWCGYIYLLAHLFIKHLLSSYYVPGTLLDAETIRIRKNLWLPTEITQDLEEGNTYVV